MLIFVSTLSTWGVGLAARKSSLSVTYHAEVVGRETTRVSRPVAHSEDNFESGPLLKLIDPPRNSSFDTCRRDPNGRSVPLPAPCLTVRLAQSCGKVLAVFLQTKSDIHQGCVPCGRHGGHGVQPAFDQCRTAQHLDSHLDQTGATTDLRGLPWGILQCFGPLVIIWA